MEPNADYGIPNQRDMTDEEKQELSKNMQNLPPEKFDEAFAIIMNGIGSALLASTDCNGSISPETFWELHRFIANYKETAYFAENRGMTYEQRQKLSNDIASLPSEKTQDVIDIFKKRSLMIGEYDDDDDAFEVDLDRTDEETLLELYRFVTSCKEEREEIHHLQVM